MGIMETLVYIIMLIFLEISVYHIMVALGYIIKALIRKIKRK